MKGFLPTIDDLEPRRLLSAAAAAKDDMVLHWNDVAMNVLRADRTLPGPGWSSRSLAITSIAVYDAVNSVERTNAPYALLAPGFDKGNTDVDAAVASAAHDALVALYPVQKNTLDAVLAASLATVKNGARETRGVALGHLTAAAILAARANDGSAAIVPYTVNDDPGHWSPDPLNPTQAAWGPGWGFVKPFALQSATQFHAPPPPAISSPEYAAAYNEVKALGAKNSTTRTAEQTQVADFWAYDATGMGTPPGMYDQHVEVIARQEHNSLPENARLFALVNLSQADAGIAAWNSKFEYDYWRPVTAIRRGGEDNNPLTQADPNWEPLGAPSISDAPDFTPPFPAYVSGHATFGAAVFKVLADFYGTDRMRFTLHSDQVSGATRSFTRFSQAAAENARSRIYMGVHWNFDDTFGQAMGRQVGDYAFGTQLEPLRGHGNDDHGDDQHLATATVRPCADGASYATLGKHDDDDGDSLFN